jgi:hypothetical protein
MIYLRSRPFKDYLWNYLRAYQGYEILKDYLKDYIVPT